MDWGGFFVFNAICDLFSKRPDVSDEDILEEYDLNEQSSQTFDDMAKYGHVAAGIRIAFILIMGIAFGLIISSVLS